MVHRSTCCTRTLLLTTDESFEGPCTGCAPPAWYQALTHVYHPTPQSSFSMHPLERRLIHRARPLLARWRRHTRYPHCKNVGQIFTEYIFWPSFPAAVRNVNGYSNIFALLFPIARLAHLYFASDFHPSPLLISNRRSSIMDSYFHFLLWLSSSPHS